MLYFSYEGALCKIWVFSDGILKWLWKNVWFYMLILCNYYNNISVFKVFDACDF
jgi:hypothetical protein